MAELQWINPLTGFFLYVLGCVGGINGLANILGNEVCNIYKLFMKSNLQEAVELHLRLVAPNAVVRNSTFQSEVVTMYTICLNTKKF
jgi:Dihydrodipicolinate synthase/N-acetylneuraminate lyase